MNRETIQKLAEEVYLTNKAFGQDSVQNDAHYKKFRDLLSVLEINGTSAKVSEIWESGMVSVDVTVEGVKY